MFSSSTTVARRFDTLAVVLSGACLVHCLLLPIAAAFLPLLSHAANAEWVHWVFVALAMPTSFLALRHHGNRSLRIVLLRVAATLGLVFLVCGALGWPSHATETLVTVLGGLILASVHIVNYATGHNAA
ncbi:MAG: MerC domain-containing protein [Hyphomonadaceae bacterium]|jgi:hypothetical protein|nr:MerC domain-containing protein [Hyphomonadaceae bacterium]